MKTAVQQLMIGKACKSQEAASNVLRKIEDAGYDSIELNGFMIRPTSLVVRALTNAAGMKIGNCGNLEWQKLIADSKLSVVAIHEDLGTIENNLDMVVCEAKMFNCNKIVVTGMYKFDYSAPAKVAQLCEQLNSAGRALSQCDIQLLYHNHNAEFLRYYSQNTFGKMISSTNPEYVNFELDVFWAADAGVDPIDVMDALGNRLKLLHLTDRGARFGTKIFTPIVKQKCVELGAGNLNLPAFCKKAEEIGVETAILESHKNWIQGDPVKSLQLSSKFFDAWVRHEAVSQAGHKNTARNAYTG